jgi:hypothetical protein
LCSPGRSAGQLADDGDNALVAVECLADAPDDGVEVERLGHGEDVLGALGAGAREHGACRAQGAQRVLGALLGGEQLAGEPVPLPECEL